MTSLELHVYSMNLMKSASGMPVCVLDNELALATLFVSNQWIRLPPSSSESDIKVSCMASGACTLYFSSVVVVVVVVMLVMVVTSFSVSITVM